MLSIVQYRWIYHKAVDSNCFLSFSIVAFTVNKRRLETLICAKESKQRKNLKKCKYFIIEDNNIALWNSFIVVMYDEFSELQTISHEQDMRFYKRNL